MLYPQDKSNDSAFLYIQKEGTEFSLRSGYDNEFKNYTEIEDGTVEAVGFVRCWEPAEKEVSCSAAMCVGFRGIGCVGMCEDHVGGVITNFGIGMGVEIVKEMLGMFDCLCG